ncbi:SIR2 family protein [Janthinobacterium sp. PLB04]|uniref:SIR2 family protein n=1 Tax=Janthinobacterium TaxID=29580 RepID=UPI001783BF9B|nr:MULTISPECIES: SIR2 family protein [Janthinobacterium]UGQ34317.1 SIR2 family protein [Janthinobacterium sp. PLB04]
MKKKLLITVGAGASIDFGMPSVSDVDRLIDSHANKNFPLTNDPSSNLYRYCRDAIAQYYVQNPKSGLRKSVNFEEVLYQLNLIAAYHTDKNFSHGSNALLKPVPLPDVDHFGRSTQVDAGLLRSISSTAIDTIVNEFIDKCKQATTQKSAEIAALTKFLDDLSNSFDIGILTLNYDNIFTQARPNLYTGFDRKTGSFDAHGVMTRTQWEFIYHMHGSMHFEMQGSSSDMHAISWTRTPATSHVTSSNGRNTQSSMEGTDFPTSTIIAGYGKTQQMMRQPFRTFYAQANRLVHEADSLLFLGYGFGDLHMNALFSEVRNRQLPTVLVDYANNLQDPLPFRMDDWSYNMLRTLQINTHKMSAPGHTAAADIADLKARKELEMSTDPQVRFAVWYDGMAAATQYSQKILHHLL